MKSRKIKTEISEKLKNVCEELSEKERKGVLVGMLVTSTVLCGITVARAFGRFLSHGTQKELPFVHPVDSLHRADKDSIMSVSYTHLDVYKRQLLISVYTPSKVT